MKRTFKGGITAMVAVLLAASLLVTGCNDSNNGGDTTAPALSLGSVSALSSAAGTTATLKFTSNEAGTCYYVVLTASTAAPDAAAVKAATTGIKGTAAATANENTISVTGLMAETAYKAYIVVQDASGNLSSVLTIDDVNPVVSGAPDTTPPTFSSATVNGATLAITLSEVVTGTPNTGDFTVSGIAGTPVVSNAAVNGAVIMLTLSSAASNSDTVTLAYTKNSDAAKQIKDAAGNALATFTNKPVTNSTSLFPNVIPVDFGGASTKTVDLSGLETGKQVYLVTVNTNSTVVNAGNTGGVQGSYSGPSGLRANLSGSLLDIPPGHHPGAVAFNANPPPITPDMRRSLDPSRSALIVPYTVGVSTKNFWIESSINSRDYVQKSAKLLAQGTHSNIWVIEDWGAYTVSSAAAQALADKFDLIYPLETKILGYEYGGGPGGDGGKDGDDRVQILVYDFYAGSGNQGDVAGFYSSKDFYLQENLITQKTNLAEMFYINAQWMTEEPEDIYSTLVHEFQHMINFNVKYVKHSERSQTWYNEMLSMAAEDMISPLIGIPPTNGGHPTASWISGFLRWYSDEGVTRWTASFDSYSYKYAFGAYLARNYGGAELVKNILANNSTNEASIVAALQQTTGNTGIDFSYAVEKFAEAFIFSDPASGRATFNKTVVKTISGTTYTFTGFDIWNRWGGPTIYPLSNRPTMQPNSVYVQSSDDWRGGTLSSPVTLNKPADAGVKLFLMVR